MNKIITIVSIICSSCFTLLMWWLGSLVAPKDAMIVQTLCGILMFTSSVIVIFLAIDVGYFTYIFLSKINERRI